MGDLYLVDSFDDVFFVEADSYDSAVQKVAPKLAPGYREGITPRLLCSTSDLSTDLV